MNSIWRSSRGRLVASALVVVGALVLGPLPVAAQQKESHLDRVVKSRKLRACIWPEYYAISYKNPKTGRLEGIDIDLAKEFAGELKAELQFVETSFSAFIADLQTDKCDIGMFGIGATLSRAQAVEFSEPYIVTSIYGVTRKDHPKVKSWEELDQDGIVVATQLGSYVDGFMKSYLKKAKVLSVQPPGTREGEVATGRADVLMADYPVAKKLEATQDWAKIINPTEPLAVTPYAYAVAPGDQVWLNYINLFLKTVKRDGRLLNAARNNGLEPVVNLN
ncbi:MAG: cyclohexadienyl dehydratase [Actinomycetota bacterium]|jgi:ABC-type amino acid transport substrate-binding protein|nr:cyclohexadienyl dehydratase [Actinomycetota bacterium]